MDDDSLFAGCAITPEQQAFGNAMDEYKRRHDRPYPTWWEAMQVALSLGYRKVAKKRAPGEPLTGDETDG